MAGSFFYCESLAYTRLAFWPVLLALVVLSIVATAGALNACPASYTWGILGTFPNFPGAQFFHP